MNKHYAGTQPNRRNYGGFSSITFHNTIDLSTNTELDDGAGATPTYSYNKNQYIDFRFMRLTDTDDAYNAGADPNVTLGEDQIPLNLTSTMKDLTIDQSSIFYERAMITDGKTGNVGIGSHFARGTRPFKETSEPDYTLDVQGSLRLIAQVDDPGGSMGNVWDGVDGVLGNEGGTDPDPSTNYGFPNFTPDMGEIIIQKERP